MPRTAALVGFVLLVAIVNAPPVAAQTPKGYLSLFTDYFPNQRDAVELRGRIFVEERLEPSPRITVDLSGFAEGLLSRRAIPGPPSERETVDAGILRVHDANVMLTGERLDLLVGYARVPWGKLDEIQPTDVVNPLDVSRFFFEGRSEARLPVLLVRGRWHPRPDLAVEGIYVPDFRRGRFDRLDEPTSPFNLPLALTVDPSVLVRPLSSENGCLACSSAIVVDAREPSFTWENAQGGVRVSTTSGRVDWSVSAYRGFEPFALYRLETSSATPVVTADYPRFTMLGADFESVRGKWGVRGEAAAFVNDSFQSPELRIVSGTSFDVGTGVDRRAGDYTISATVLLHTESYDRPLSTAMPKDRRTDVSIIASADRTLAREKYRLRTFVVYNAVEHSVFARVIGITTLKDNLAVEASLGWFAGDGAGLIGRFGDSDFAYARLKYYF